MANSALGKARVLVVEDEESIRRGLCDVLSFRGCEVQFVEDGLSALARLEAERFELVLLDVMLPELDGFSVCQRLRARGDQTPVVMLTAKGSEEDVVHGFELGADDYVTKPFSVRELLARVQAVLKRLGPAPSARFRCGPFEVDGARAEAHGPAGVVPLSARELRILQLLAQDPGRIVSRRRLLREVWEMNNAEQVETRTVDVHVAKLRKKLDHEGLIETVRGQGYRLCGPVR